MSLPSPQQPPPLLGRGGMAPGTARPRLPGPSSSSPSALPSTSVSGAVRTPTTPPRTPPSMSPSVSAAALAAVPGVAVGTPPQTPGQTASPRGSGACSTAAAAASAVGAASAADGALIRSILADGGGGVAELTSYGMHLRAWTDTQVDMRLGQLLKGLDLEGVRRDVASAQAAAEVASVAVERLQDEVKSVREAQQCTIQAVQYQDGSVMDLQRELRHLRRESAASIAAAEQLQQQRSLSRPDQGNGSTDELSVAGLEDLNSSYSDALGLERRLSAWRAEVQAEVAQRLSVVNQREMPQEDLTESVAMVVQKRLEAARVDGTSAVGAAALEAGLEMRIDETRADLERQLDEVSQRLEARVAAATTHDELLRQLADVRTRLEDDLEGLQRRLLAVLRADMAAAFRSQAQAVTALDQGLRCRLGELARKSSDRTGGQEGGSGTAPPQAKFTEKSATTSEPQEQEQSRSVEARCVSVSSSAYEAHR
eukprot:TRINITY_DN18195_c0_g1_i1.p1 TRINITY_DN18195_c0_g1~~TRINITY_DN18195_c0_g1_i1.p1  ORF type:complete len:483 (-),score=115.48 TRINITY_DN18195_c0_g1_i1:193-1641(-)